MRYRFYREGVAYVECLVESDTPEEAVTRARDLANDDKRPWCNSVQSEGQWVALLPGDLLSRHMFVDADDAQDAQKAEDLWEKACND